MILINYIIQIVFVVYRLTYSGIEIVINGSQLLFLKKSKVFIS